MNSKAGDGVGLTPVDYDPFAGPALARVVPTTEPQREVWLADRLGQEASLAYSESVSLRFSGLLNIGALRGALQDLVGRHEALRATVSASGEELFIAGDIAVEVPVSDLSTLARPERDATVAAVQRRAVETPFDVERGPLVRAEILKTEETEHLLVITAHHIVCDGWSFGVLVHELGSLYRRRIGAPGKELEPPPSFGDYALAQRARSGGEQDAAAEAYWLSRFPGPLPALDLPTDRPRGAWRTFTSRREDYVLDAGLVSEVRKAGARDGAGLFATLLGVFAALMQRISGSEETVVGIPAAGQSVGGLDGLVGHCVSLLPLRVAVAPSASMKAVVAAAQTAMLDAYGHQEYTFGTLLKKLAIERDPSRLPLVSVMFNVDQALDANTAGFPGLGVDFASNPRSYENFELFVNAVQVNGALRLECQYNAELFDGATIRRWLACYEALLRAASGSADASVGSVALAGADDRRLLAEWNRTSRPFSRTTLVHELIEVQANRAQHHIAITWQGAGLSYGALETRANRIARCLRARGVRRGALVGLHIERGPDMVAAVLAVMKAGAAYVPLDPSYPGDRLAFMAQDAGLSVLVTEASLASPLAWPRDRSLLLDADGAQIAAQPEQPLPRDEGSAEPEDPAYVIYTSGSTGEPKGVRVPHRAVVNFLVSMQREPGLKAGDRLIAVTTLSFDIAVLELFLPLSVGAEVVLAGRDEALDGHALARLIAASQANVMQATPTTWRLLLDAGWRGAPGFKALIGGEALPRDIAVRLLASTGELWNMYGPTETTVWSTCWRVARPEEGIAIGRPIANTAVWILDDNRQRCPIGLPGEIWIGGEGVTLGYLNRPELTAERFIADPFSAAPGARLYRTGDRGRWRADGLVEHRGRNDFQVKVRGHRVELGEIEAGLASHPAVAHTVVVVREDEPDDLRIAAYYVPRGAAPETGALRGHLQKMLPAYMVPQHFVPLAAIPLLPNGKINRNALPAPGTSPRKAGTAPRGEAQTGTDRLLAGIWRELLKIQDVGTEDNFFDLGGHSLLAMQAISIMEGKTSKRVNPRRYIFETLGQIARAYDEALPEAAASPGRVHRFLSALVGVKRP